MRDPRHVVSAWPRRPIPSPLSLPRSSPPLLQSTPDLTPNPFLLFLSPPSSPVRPPSESARAAVEFCRGATPSRSRRRRRHPTARTTPRPFSPSGQPRRRPERRPRRRLLAAVSPCSPLLRVFSVFPRAALVDLLRALSFDASPPVAELVAPLYLILLDREIESPASPFFLVYFV